ncbi:MAG TPA: rhamnan synthesis F family protein [Anaerolineales bacterium]|nr:rhamnan synthesis F family protein [Anaerolineales bacterium]
MSNYLSDYWLLLRSGLFDKQYYLDHYPDVRAAGVDPLWHFIRQGWKEGRNPSQRFNTKYYLDQNPDVRAVGMNPLTHYLRYGITEGRVGFPRPRYADLPGDDAENTLREREAYQAPLEFLSGDGERKQPLSKEHDTAVILHVYYPEIFQEITGYLANLDGDFDLYVSIPESHAEYAHDILASFPQARIYLTENRGRDIAPFLRLLPAIHSLGYSHILKLHTKQSPHRVDGKLWRNEVYEKLVGSREIVSLAKNRLQTDPQAGILGPKGHVLNNRLYAGGNAANISMLAYKAGIAAWQEVPFFFVAGTMFWAKPEAFQSFQNITFRSTDFEPEPIEADGALVHGVERFFGLAAVHAGFKTLEIDTDGQITEPEPKRIYQYTPVPQYHLLGSEQQIKSIVFYSAYKEEYAIEYLRIIAPLQRAGIEIIRGVEAGEINADKVFYGDAVIFQREFPQNLAAYEHIVQAARQANKPIIYEIDDLLFALPEGHPEKQLGAYTDSLMPMLLAVTEADLVTVTTEPLQKALSQFNQNIAVLPNYLDDSLWTMKPPGSGRGKGEALILGYMGSNSHKPDLELISPVLVELLKRYPGQLQIRIWGTEPPQILRKYPQVKWVPAPSNNYKEFVRYFQTQQADIFVAPLADNLFNQCKSALKFFEYSALGAAGVYSRIAPYTEVITQGHDGFLASTREEWLQYLIQLIENDVLRQTLAENAQTTIRSKWLLSQNINRWYEVFDDLPDIVSAKKNGEHAQVTLLKAIAAQQHQVQVKQNDELTQFKEQVIYLTAQLNQQSRMSRGIGRRSGSKAAHPAENISPALQRARNSLSWQIDQTRRRSAMWIKKLRRRVDWIRFSRLLEQSELFDPVWYLENYPDVAAAKINPVRHYILYGGFEGRDPGPKFSSSWYLETYPDVKQSGMNPLIHYLRFGVHEGRLSKEYLFRRQQDQAATIAAPPVKVLQPAEIKRLIEQKIHYNRYIISISHNDYLKETTGGVQVYIAHEQKSVFRDGTSYLHLFPDVFGLNLLLDENANFWVGINLDGEHLGVSEINAVIEAIGALPNLTLENIHIHHSMGFNIHAIQKILDIGSRQAEFWLHDFFSLCPSYHLLRNELEYCGAPNVNSNACGICKYGEHRKEQQPALWRLFEENNLQVIAPSSFALNFWQDKFPIKNIPGKVRPLLSLRWSTPAPVKKGLAGLRIGYLGFPLDQKGWKTWLKLVEACATDSRYKFFHFSSAEGTLGNYQRIHVAVTPEKPSMMIDTLRQENIDVALLWSVVPETFSFTLHEALAAGCFIVTNKKSGNIQDFLRRNPEYGMVLDGENDLLALFANGELARRVKQYQVNGKPTGELVHHGL